MIQQSTETAGHETRFDSELVISMGRSDNMRRTSLTGSEICLSRNEMANSVNDTTRIAKPAARPLRVYAFDPSAGRYVGNEMVAEVRYEELRPGPIGERFAVIDYDGTEKVYYEAVNLDDPSIIVRRGLDPSETDPRFHQQMVYVVASETLAIRSGTGPSGTLG